MFIAYMFLHNSTLQQDLPIGLALCVVPLILGWLIAYAFHNVPGLKGQIATMERERTELQKKIQERESEITDLRMKIDSLDYEIHTQRESISRLKDQVIILENDLRKLREAGD